MELEVFGFMFQSVFGWRFLFSRAYRASTLKRWDGESGINVAMDIAGTTVGMLLTVGVVWVILLR